MGSSQLSFKPMKSLPKEPVNKLFDIDSISIQVEPVKARADKAAVTDFTDRLTENKAAVMPAHNCFATRNAVCAIVIKGGETEAAGTPEELLGSNEFCRMFSRTL